MDQAERASDLGPFAPEQGAAGKVAVAGLGAAALSLTCAIARPILNLAGMEGRFLTTVAELAALLGIGLALGAGFQVGVRGLPGRTAARLGLGAAATGGIAAFLYAADRDGSLQLGRFFEVYFDPEIIALVWRDLVKGLLNTLKAAFVAEGVGLVAGLVVATFAISDRPWLRLPGRTYVDLVRGTPLLVLAFLINFGLVYVGITLPFFTSVVTILAVNASAYIAEIFRAGIQSVPRGQVDAARGLGMPYGAAMVYVVIPQAVRSVIPPLMNEFIALVKDTAIVFLAVGVTVQSRDLFTAARGGASSTFSPTPYVIAAVGYLIVTIPLTRMVDRLERRLRVGLA